MATPNHNFITVLIRVGLGAVFLYSGTIKVIDPSAFTGIVTNYQLLSPSLVVATAIVLPWIELLCGMALIFGRFEIGAALLTTLMMVVFIGIGFYNVYRGLDIACGCFSLSAREPANIISNTARDLAILGAGAWILKTSWKPALSR